MWAENVSQAGILSTTLPGNPAQMYFSDQIECVSPKAFPVISFAPCNPQEGVKGSNMERLVQRLQQSLSDKL